MNLRTAVWAILAVAAAALSPAVATCQDDAESLFQRGADWFTKAEYKTALAVFERYLLEYPESERAPEAAFKIGDCHRALGETSEAVVAYERALQLFGDSPRAAEVHFLSGEAKLELGFIQDSLNHFKAARELGPDQALLVKLDTRLSETYYDLGSFAEAVKPLERLLAETDDPRVVPAARIKLADSYHRVGEYEKACDVFEDLARQNRDDLQAIPALLFQWAESLYFTGSLQRARAVLEDILARFPSPPLRYHAVMRLGDVQRRDALNFTQEEIRKERLRAAALEYIQLLPDGPLISVQDDIELRRLAICAILRLIEVADIGGFDVQAEFGLPAIDSLLDKALDISLDPETKALILVRKARHLLLAGSYRESMGAYRELTTIYSHASIGAISKPEYSAAARALMLQAHERADYATLVQLYTDDGARLELTSDEILNVAEAYERLEIDEDAERLYREALGGRIGTAQWRRATLGLARLELLRKNYGAARQRLEEFLDRQPPAGAAESAKFMLLSSYFAQGDLQALQQMWEQRSSMLDTDRLRATCLYQNGMLLKRYGQLARAQEFLERFYSEFGRGIKDDLTVQGYVVEALRALGDLYYDSQQWKRAGDYYELYIALFGRSEDIAWPLFQVAGCRRRLGQTALARSVLEELVRLYPRRRIASQARAILDELDLVKPD